MEQRKVAIITGASSGIGRITAVKLAQHGYHVVLVARRKELLDEVASHILRNNNPIPLVIAGDLTSSDFIEYVVSYTMETFERIDVLINSSGYGTFKPATTFTYDEIANMFEINVFAMMYLSQLCAIHIIDSDNGHIIFLGSAGGKIATASSSVYSATKFAIIGYANALRLELKPMGIQVTTVNPGPVKTAFFDYDETMKQYYQRVESFALDVEPLADSIIKGIIHPFKAKREINTPSILNIVAILYSIFPRLGDFLATNMFNFKEES